MNERARQLADRFDQAAQEMARTIEELSDAEWRTPTAAEGWTVGVVAHHVADNHEGLAGLARMIASGQPIPDITWEQIHRGNAEHARRHASTTKAETLALFRANAARASEIVRGLSDAQLDRSATVIGNVMTAAQVIEHILIGHVHQHHRSIQQARGGP